MPKRWYRLFYYNQNTIPVEDGVFAAEVVIKFVVISAVVGDGNASNKHNKIRLKFHVIVIESKKRRNYLHRSHISYFTTILSFNLFNFIFERLSINVPYDEEPKQSIYLKWFIY